MTSNEEDTPALRSSSIRPMERLLDEQHHRQKQKQRQEQTTNPFQIHEAMASSSKSTTTNPSSSSNGNTTRKTLDPKQHQHSLPQPTVLDLIPRPLSPLIMLSRSTLRIEKAESCRQVLNVMDDWIRARNISFVVDLETACVECQVGPCLTFAIYLWLDESEDNNNKNNNGVTPIIVELQRRQGCCIVMQRLRRDLFDVLQNKSIPHATEQQQQQQEQPQLLIHSTVQVEQYPRKTISPRIQQMMKAACGPKDHLQRTLRRNTTSSLIGPADTTACTTLENGITTCARLMGSERLDQNHLGLELLVSLTDPSQTNSFDRNMHSIVAQLFPRHHNEDPDDNDNSNSSSNSSSHDNNNHNNINTDDNDRALSENFWHLVRAGKQTFRRSFLHHSYECTASKGIRSSFSSSSSSSLAPDHHHHHHPSSATSSTNNTEPISDDDDHHRRTRILCLTILLQAFQVASTNPVLIKSVITSLLSWRRSSSSSSSSSYCPKEKYSPDCSPRGHCPLAWQRAMVALLRGCLRDPARYPQEAALAVQIIRILELQQEIQNDINQPRHVSLFCEVELMERLVEARRVGETHYRLLQRESESLLQHHLSTVQ